MVVCGRWAHDGTSPKDISVSRRAEASSSSSMESLIHAASGASLSSFNICDVSSPITVVQISGTLDGMREDITYLLCLGSNRRPGAKGSQLPAGSQSAIWTSNSCFSSNEAERRNEAGRPGAKLLERPLTTGLMKLSGFSLSFLSASDSLAAPVTSWPTFPEPT